MSLELTISIPVAPEPEYAAKYRRMHEGSHVVAPTPVLKVEVYDSQDGYGIVGEDMVAGRSISISPNKDFQARMRYLPGGGKPDYPIFVYTHERNEGRVHIAWALADGSERGVNLLPGRTFDLRDVWADGWIIEAKA